MSDNYNELIIPYDKNTIHVWFNISTLVDMVTYGISNINFHTNVSDDILHGWIIELKKMYDIYTIVYHKKIPFFTGQYKTLTIKQKNNDKKFDKYKYGHINIIDIFVKDFVNGKKRKYYYVEYLDENIDIDIMDEIKIVLKRFNIYVTYRKDESNMYFFSSERYLFKIKNL